MNSRAYLDRLVAFPSVSSRSNRDIATFIADSLQGVGVAAEWIVTGDKASLFATIGPAGKEAGIILSGHMDVVPVEGQSWTSDPFALRERGGRLYGRGTADMKGFLACVLSLAERLRGRRLATPVHLCFSHDEEVGCVGVRPMLDLLAARGLRARLCLVGEPTSMGVVNGHKGKLAAVATCRGVAGHSAQAPMALNAIHLAADLINGLRALQARLRLEGARDPAYDVPYSTVHAGVIAGGTALNIVPDLCRLDFEVRTVAADHAPDLLGAIVDEADRLSAARRTAFPQAGITIEAVNSYPGLDTAPDHEAVRLMQSLTGDGRLSKVAYGTEAGLFVDRLGLPAVVCGPGSMAQAHKADEFVTEAELDRCDRFLDGLVDRACGPASG